MLKLLGQILSIVQECIVFALQSGQLSFELDVFMEIGISEFVDVSVNMYGRCVCNYGAVVDCCGWSVWNVGAQIFVAVEVCPCIHIVAGSNSCCLVD